MTIFNKFTACLLSSFNFFCLAFLYNSFFYSPDAHAQVTANIAVTSDYVWRGISQNNEDIALQGGFDYNHYSGLYIGTWGSNVAFDNASTEIDIYAGWSYELKNGIAVDIGIIEYTYHGSANEATNGKASDNNFTEYYLGLSYAGFTGQYSVGDEFDDHWQLGYEHNFGSLSANAGYFDYDSYDYFKVGLATEQLGLTFSLDYWNTSISNDKLADDRLVLSIAKSF